MKAWVVLFWLVLGLSAFPAWVTHVIYCLMTDRWGFLIAGALVFPIAIIHGWIIWLGALFG